MNLMQEECWDLPWHTVFLLLGRELVCDLLGEAGMKRLALLIFAILLAALLQNGCSIHDEEPPPIIIFTGDPEAEERIEMLERNAN